VEVVLRVKRVLRVQKRVLYVFCSSERGLKKSLREFRINTTLDVIVSIT